MIVRGRHLSRRALLRGVSGVAVALPFLALLGVLCLMVRDMLGPSGYTFTPPWTAHELTILTLLAVTACDNATLRRMGESGRALVAETLGWDGIADRFLALYQQLAAARGGVHRRAAA